MNSFIDGILSLPDGELKIMYKIGLGNEYFCVSLESKNEYLVGQTFYINKNLIK